MVTRATDDFCSALELAFIAVSDKYIFACWPNFIMDGVVLLIGNMDTKIAISRNGRYFKVYWSTAQVDDGFTIKVVKSWAYYTICTFGR